MSAETTTQIVYTAKELVESPIDSILYLLKPVLPQKGTAILAGAPDVGKSQFARQLCIHIAYGETSFLDFELHAIHKRAIYVTTEDCLEAVAPMLKKQLRERSREDGENLRFIFADTMNQNKIITELRKELSAQAADIVVIDSFGDVFEGKDSNSNTEMRKTIRKFHSVAAEHNCCVLLLHHINKSAYSLSPSQKDIQGGSGLVQKTRTALILSNGKEGKKSLRIAKGNYTPRAYKDHAFELRFNEETLLFDHTGRLLNLEQDIPEHSVIEEDPLAEIREAAIAIFGQHVLSYTEFCQGYVERKHVSEPTAKRHHRKLLSANIIIQTEDNKYRINPEMTEDEPSGEAQCQVSEASDPEDT